MKLKDMQLQKLSEQIKVRDEMLNNARQRDHPHIDEDPRFIHIDELASSTVSILPPITSNTLGKTSGALIKQLLDNLTANEHKIKHSNAT